MHENVYCASAKLINARKLQPAQTAIHRQHNPKAPHSPSPRPSPNPNPYPIQFKTAACPDQASGMGNGLWLLYKFYLLAPFAASCAQYLIVFLSSSPSPSTAVAAATATAAMATAVGSQKNGCCKKCCIHLCAKRRFQLDVNKKLLAIVEGAPTETTTNSIARHLRVHTKQVHLLTHTHTHNVLLFTNTNQSIMKNIIFWPDIDNNVNNSVEL